MKNRIIKISNIIVILVILAILKISVISAQGIHEFSVDAGLGSSSLRYKLSHGDRSGRVGGDFGVGYTYFFDKVRITSTGKVFRELWGIHTGMGIGLYNAKAKLDDANTENKGLNDGDTSVEDPKYNVFDLRTKLDNYSEIQKTVYLNIPVMAQFQIEQIYAMAGFKFGIPISGKFSSDNATITNAGWYPELGNLATTQEFAGYGTFNGRYFEGNFESRFAVIFALEAGYKWRIADNLSIYTGMYFDCGLNNTCKEADKAFVNYNNKRPKEFSTNSVLSSYSDNKKLTTFTDKTKLMAVGIKLRFAMEK